MIIKNIIKNIQEKREEKKDIEDFKYFGREIISLVNQNKESYGKNKANMMIFMYKHTGDLNVFTFDNYEVKEAFKATIEAYKKALVTKYMGKYEKYSWYKYRMYAFYNHEIFI